MANLLVGLRREYARLITSAGQLALFVVAAQDVQAGIRLGALAAAALISAAAWRSALLRARAIGDTPTSRIASAAQGYVELKGRGRAPGGTPLVSPLTALPCLWFRYRVERRENDRWVPDGSDESSDSFVLDDGSGECLVDPEGAEMLVRRRETWTHGDRRYTQWLLIENDPLYVLGSFVTRAAPDALPDTNADMRLLLAQWKKEPKRLVERFDLDRDGRLDLREWELARSQARREVERAQREARLSGELHLVQRPPDARLYLIADLDPERLARRYRLWSTAHLALLFLALAGLAWLSR
ncbi:MAG: hypothetical protein Fur0039_14020 [Rhodocyclaceae bacterium]